MKHLKMISLLMMCATACVQGPIVTSPLSAARQMNDEQELRELQQKWMQAWVREDRAVLERILAPEYKLIVSSMPDRPISREQWLALIGRYTAEAFDYDKMVVRIFGDTAVVSSLGHIRGAKVDGIDRSGTFFLTDVWRRGVHGWQVISRYSSKPEDATSGARALEKPAD